MMATGSDANSFWNLFEELEARGGGVYANDLLLTNLIKFLPAHLLNRFVEEFRSDWEMPSLDLQDPDSETDIITLRPDLLS